MTARRVVDEDREFVGHRRVGTLYTGHSGNTRLTFSACRDRRFNMASTSSLVRRSVAMCGLVFAGSTAPVAGQATCGSSAGPDVIVGDLFGWNRYGTVGTISGYTFGTTSCNMGNAVLQWIAASNQHPVIGMNAYRLKNGRFEQIGMSWVKHGWGAAHDSLCCTCIDPQNFQQLGIGCSDPYDAGTNGIQGGFMSGGVLVAGIGPRSDINPYTGAFNWPYTAYGLSGNAIYKRLQIQIDDLNPALNSGAMYFAEGQYVTPNDSAAGNNYNNTGYKQFTVGSLINGAYSLSFGAAAMHRQASAIMAWPAGDPTVGVKTADVPGDGRFMLGARVSNNGKGTWHFEYALYNMNSDRSASEFSVPLPLGAVVTNVGFHDVPYHSGELYDGADWPQMTDLGAARWATADFATNPNANALRWGTLYNFRFDANTPPRNTSATLGLFKPGTPATINILTRGPSRLGDTDGNDIVDVDDLINIILSWGACANPPASCPNDLVGNGTVDVDDLTRVILNWG